MSTEITGAAQERKEEMESYTAFGSGVSTEILISKTFPFLKIVRYTAFGSGVSTEIRKLFDDLHRRETLHSLRLRGEH